MIQTAHAGTPKPGSLYYNAPEHIVITSPFFKTGDPVPPDYQQGRRDRKGEYAKKKAREQAMV